MPKINNDVATIQKWLNNGGDLSKLLNNYDSLSDEEKSIQQIIEKIKYLDNNKVEKDGDKSLSTNDFTDDFLEKLKGIESGATKTIVDNELKKLSSNPVANSAVKKALDDKVDKEDDKGLSTNDYSNEEKHRLNELNYYADFETTSEYRFTRDSHFKVNEADSEEVESVNLVTYVDGNPVIKDRKFKDSFARNMAQNANSVAASAREMIGKVEGTANQALERANNAINFTQELEQNVAFLDMRVSEMGNDIQANIKPKLTDLDKDIADLEDRKANVFSMNAKGENINIKDSADAKFRGLKLFGKTNQLKTTGKNLIPYPFRDANKTINGVTFTDNGDGTITVNGTATANAAYIFANNVPLTKGETYTLSGCPAGGSRVTYNLVAQDVDSNPGHVDVGTGKGVSFQAQYDKYYFYAVVSKDTTITNKVFKPMLELSSSATKYEPYTGGKPSPSPEYPQEIINSNEINLNVVNKNLLPYPYFDGGVGTVKTHNGLTYTVNEDRSITVNGTSTAASYFVLQKNVDYGAIMNGNTNGTYVSSERVYYNPANKVASLNFQEGTNVNKTFYPQIEKGTVITEYVPHNKQTLTIPGIYRGIPVSKNGNYTDANGQQWLCDEIDFTRGVRIQRIAKIILNGTENWRSDENYYNETSNSFYLQRGSLTPNKKKGVSNIMSDKLSFSADLWSGANIAEGICGYRSDAYYDLFIRINNSRIGSTSNVVATNVALLKEWLQKNPITVMYEMAEPIETQLTEEQIAQYKELKTYNLTTNIYEVGGAGIEVEYVVDTKTYIDNKFAELQQAIISMGGNI